MMSAGKSGASLDNAPDDGPRQGEAKGGIRRRLSRIADVRARGTRSSQKQPSNPTADPTRTKPTTAAPGCKAMSRTNSHPSEGAGPAGTPQAARAARLRRRKRNAGWLRLVIALILFLPPLLGVWRWHSKSQVPGLINSLVALAVFWLVVLAILEVAGRGDKNQRRSIYGFLNIAIGSDGRIVEQARRWPLSGPLLSLRHSCSCLA